MFQWGYICLFGMIIPKTARFFDGVEICYLHPVSYSFFFAYGFAEKLCFLRNISIKSKSAGFLPKLSTFHFPFSIFNLKKSLRDFYINSSFLIPHSSF